MNVVIIGFIIIVLTLISGWADSRGFIHAANIWNQNKIIWSEVARSALGFGIGITTYWIIIKFLREIGIIAPEVQTVGWFAITIIGVALSSGKFASWQLIDQIIAVCIFVGVAWLLIRVGG